MYSSLDGFLSFTAYGIFLFCFFDMIVAIVKSIKRKFDKKK